MMKNTRLTLQLADKPIRVELDNFTADRAFDLFDKVAEIRIRTSPYAKFPKEEGETNEQWRERISKDSEKDQIRKDGEDTDKYLKRVFDAKHESYNLAFEILNAICEVFGQEKVTEARFKSAHWMKTKQFIYDVLSLGDVPCGDFEPKELSTV
jgi:hypothetical protein